MPSPALTPSACSEFSVESEPSVPPVRFECDHCGNTCEGEPGGAGLLLWTRGDEVRFEEPPLCSDCASRLTIGALFSWTFGEEED